MSIGQLYPSESAINRLATVDKSAEKYDRAIRLGQSVWRQIDLANTDPSMQLAGSASQHERVAGGKECKISGRVSAWLNFVVDAAFDDLQSTPDWLPHTERVDLRLNLHDNELPDDLGAADDDPISEVTIRLAPDPGHEAGRDGPRSQPYIATYENSTKLDAQDTETVIGILALIAEQDS